MPNFDIGSAVSAPTDALAITYDELRREVGRLLGWGRDPDNWSATRATDGADILKAGLRKFYAPPPLPGERWSHEWSFLRPVATLTLEEDEYQYDLPTNFAMFDGPLTYAPGDNLYYPSVQIVGEHQVRKRLQESDTTGQPQIAAVRPKTVDTTEGTRYEIIFWPTADDAYELQYRYKINPIILDDSAPLHLGGQPHSETVKEAVLAAAEEMFMPTSNAHQMKFIELLRGSVSHDRKASSPDTLGFNIDRSDCPEYFNRHDWNETLVTYNPS